MTTRTPDELRAKAAAKRLKADDLTAQANRAADNAPGGFATGRSGRSRAQNRATARALDVTIDNAVKAVRLLRDARDLEARAAAVDGEPERKRVKLAVAEGERQERAARAALPLANDPAAPEHMTRAEWKGMHPDFKGTLARDGMRRRAIMRAGALSEVFLTDMKHRVAP